MSSRPAGLAGWRPPQRDNRGAPASIDLHIVLARRENCGWDDFVMRYGYALDAEALTQLRGLLAQQDPQTIASLIEDTLCRNGLAGLPHLLRQANVTRDMEECCGCSRTPTGTAVAVYNSILQAATVLVARVNSTGACPAPEAAAAPGQSIPRRDAAAPGENPPHRAAAPVEHALRHAAAELVEALGAGAGIVVTEYAGRALVPLALRASRIHPALGILVATLGMGLGLAGISDFDDVADDIARRIRNDSDERLPPQLPASNTRELRPGDRVTVAR